MVGTLGRGHRAARDALILVRAETARKAWDAEKNRAAGMKESRGRRLRNV